MPLPRQSSARSANARRAKVVSPRAHTVWLADHLRGLYASEEWALFTEVRSHTGTRSPEVLRYADAIGVKLIGSADVYGFELKTSRADWLRELRNPAKSSPLKLNCHRWYLVVRAPWKKVVLSTTELPDLWGLIEIGTGAPQIVLEATLRREASEIDPFVQSLLRAAGRAAEVEMGPPEEFSPRIARITRPSLSRDHVGLDCGHVAARPLAKVMPLTALCFACPRGLPVDREIGERAIREASDEEYAHLRRVFAEEDRRRGLLPPRTDDEARDAGGGEP